MDNKILKGFYDVGKWAGIIFAIAIARIVLVVGVGVGGWLAIAIAIVLGWNLHRAV